MKADSDDIVVCRCEDVTLGEIQRLLDEGKTTLDEIKRLLRCTMGPCQGRTCRPLILREIARHLGVSAADLPLPTFRTPTQPVRLGQLARLSRAGEEGRGEDHEKDG